MTDEQFLRAFGERLTFDRDAPCCTRSASISSYGRRRCAASGGGPCTDNGRDARLRSRQAINDLRRIL
jgi:hypothetical protein